MRTLQSSIFWSVQSTGGSLSRSREDLYREAADLAYYFHWSRNDVLSMTESERKQWLSEIHRVHKAEYRQRQKETLEQIQRIIEMQKNDEENFH